jgi:hypothetical protein
LARALIAILRVGCRHLGWAEDIDKRLGKDETPLSFDVVDSGELMIPGHRLSVSNVTWDEFGLRIRYLLRPGLVPDDELRSSLFWRAEARDDLGNVYQDGGGAYGPAEAEDMTVGVITIGPLPPAAARTMWIRFSPWGDTESLRDVPGCEVIVDVTSVAA